MNNSDLKAFPSRISKTQRRRSPARSSRWSAGPSAVNYECEMGAALMSLLDLPNDGVVAELLRKSLLDPIESLTSNRGKRIRGQLVQLAYRLVGGDSAVSLRAAQQCRIAAEVVELMHAGSLIVDDIEDGSPVRRGRPALHVQVGLPLALNAGNWLYFWPFELLRCLELSEARTRLAYELYNRTLLRAHAGQAIDLGANIAHLSQSSVEAACSASLQLKTGALMGFAAWLGGAVAGVSERTLAVLDEFGVDLGVALQMFDDVGNVVGKCDPQKRYEDLMLGRPSWIWACAARCFDRYQYENFLAAVARLPDAARLEGWLDEANLIEIARRAARERLDQVFAQLDRRLVPGDQAGCPRALAELRRLGEEIALAYG